MQESMLMDEDNELAATIEYITQLPSPKPHSVFFIKGLDKKKTVLILPAHVSLLNGKLYNLASNPPAPINLQLLQPPSTHHLSFEDTPTHLVRLLKSSMAVLHAQLGFMAPSTGDKASDIVRFGGERQYLAAQSWRNHTVANQNRVSAIRMIGHLLHHSDHALFTIICKSFLREWPSLVQGETFICGGGCGERRRFNDTSYTYELVLERAAVVAVARAAVQDGIRISGFKVLELLASPAGGNVVLSCQHCPNTCKGKDTTITPAQQAAILAKIRFDPSAAQCVDVEMAVGEMEEEDTEESVVMDEDKEMELATTIEYITQLPSPKPHSVFVLKGLDKKKTVLILPAHVSLLNGELYDLAANPPAPINLQLLQPPSTHHLSFEDTPSHLVRLLKSSMAVLHAQLGFMAPSTGDKDSDIVRFGGERQYLAAQSWRQHTVDNQDSQSAIRMIGHLLHHSDHALFTIICKSFLREWPSLVQGETFICGGGCGEIRRFNDTSYTFELVLERAAVVAVARKVVEGGIRISGFKVLELLASPAGGNVVLSCQHCPNTCKGLITPAQQAAILAKIRL